MPRHMPSKPCCPEHEKSDQTPWQNVPDTWVTLRVLGRNASERRRRSRDREGLRAQAARHRHERIAVGAVADGRMVRAGRAIAGTRQRRPWRQQTASSWARREPWTRCSGHGRDVHVNMGSTGSSLAWLCGRPLCGRWADRQPFRARQRGAAGAVRTRRSVQDYIAPWQPALRDIRRSHAFRSTLLDSCFSRDARSIPPRAKPRGSESSRSSDISDSCRSTASIRSNARIT